MRTPVKLLLHSRILRGQQVRPNRPTGRESRAERAHRERMALEVARRHIALHSGAELPPDELPPKFENEPQVPPFCAKWTAWGRWNPAGTRLYNARGEVIYERPKP